MKKDNKNLGQTMILTAIITGSIVLSASVIAGMLTFYQLREVNDTVKSSMALSAADTGVEASLYCYFQTTGAQNKKYEDECSIPVGSLSNGTTYKTELTCVEDDKFTVTNCSEDDDPATESEVYGIRIKSIGKKDTVERVVDTLFAIRFN